MSVKVDMHYYGTYAMALAAGIPKKDARIIAYAAQYVDDSTRENCEPEHPDKGLLVSMTTAHHFGKCVAPGLKEADYQRKVWVPNHFIPGGVGYTFEERCICTRNSIVAKKMIAEHMETALEKTFGLELMGIAAHAYEDTFSHYGFSGFCSTFNCIRNETLRVEPKKRDIRTQLEKKIKDFHSNRLIGDYLTHLQSFFTETVSAALGHGPVLSFPDIPYLEWEFVFERERPDHGPVSKRDNKKTYFEALECVHEWLCRFARRCYAESTARSFTQIEESVRSILAVEGDNEERINAWYAEGLLPEDAVRYDASDWEKEKNDFGKLAISALGIHTPVYRFHQAAAYHRYYMLKDLLPRYGIAIY